MDDTNDADMDETTDGDKMFCEGSTGVDVQDRDARSDIIVRFCALFQLDIHIFN